MSSRLFIALLALAPGACLPESNAPGYRFDSGAPLNFDVPAAEFPPLDVPPFDRVASPDGRADAGADAASDAHRRPDGPDLSRRYPQGPYGEAPPSVMVPFQLADCAMGLFRFDDSGWLLARGTVVEFTNGYCADCVSLAGQLESNISLMYGPMGMRVVTVLVDGASPGDIPTAPFCREWASSAGIRHPMAIDQAGMVRRHTDGLPLPQWVLTDENGRIVWRSGGSPTALRALAGQVQALLNGGP